MPWYPLQATYLEIFSCVCSDISNLAHRNSPKLAQIIRLIASLLSGEFQENRILGSSDICLGTKYCTLVQFGTVGPTRLPDFCRYNLFFNKSLEM